MKKNPAFYLNDGFGRDSYISYNDGGFFKNNLKPIKKKESYQIQIKKLINPLNNLPRFVNYHGDGSGRDSYIYNSGMGKLFLPLANKHLSNILRENDKNKTNKIYFLTNSQKKYLKKIKIIESNVTSRLYNDSLEKLRRMKTKILKMRSPIFNEKSSYNHHNNNDYNIENTTIGAGNNNNTNYEIDKYDSYINNVNYNNERKLLLKKLNLKHISRNKPSNYLSNSEMINENLSFLNNDIASKNSNQQIFKSQNNIQFKNFIKNIVPKKKRKLKIAVSQQNLISKHNLTNKSLINSRYENIFPLINNAM